MSLYLRRKMDAYLLNWHASQRKPLVIKGAGRVGKTACVRHFARDHYENVVEINFRSDPVYRQIVDDGYTPAAVIKNLSRINPSLRFPKGKTLIFFDDIQAFPDIVTSLKFFAGSAYDVIGAGSLHGTQNREISSVGVGYQIETEMRPLDFEEYLWSLGYDDAIRDDILSHMRSLTPFSPAVLRLYRDLFRDFCLIGGMPEVVRDFAEGRTFERTLDIQRRIIQGYEADIRAYAKGPDRSRIADVFHAIPSQLERGNRKFQITKVRPGARFRAYRGCLEWLEDAGLIHISRALQTPSLPLRGNEAEDRCVLYYADSGLLLSQLSGAARDGVRQNRNLEACGGGLLGCAVGAALVQSGYELHYFQKANSTLREEFFVRWRDCLVPIEAKADPSRAKSLSAMIQSDRYPDIRFGIRLTRDHLGFASNVFAFPRFCAFLVRAFLSALRPDGTPRPAARDR